MIPDAAARARSAAKRARTTVKLLRRGVETRGQLLGRFRQLGVRNGATVFVHSSMKSLGYVLGGTGTVLGALRMAVGPAGTIAMPAFPTEDSMEDYARTDPLFDVRTTASASGLLTEQFRRLPGTLRSLHPTHSICANGPLARELVRDHDHAFGPCGVDTPFDRLVQLDATIMRIGTAVLTLHHYAQEVLALPTLFLPTERDWRCIDGEGVQRRVTTPMYRALIPRPFFLPVDSDGEVECIRWRDYPLLHPGRGEETLRRDPHRQRALRKLLALREEFVRAGHYRIARMRNGVADAFSAGAWAHTWRTDGMKLMQDHISMYNVDDMELLRQRGLFPQ